MQTYLVGGAVRDYLLGLPVKDRDWVVVVAAMHNHAGAKASRQSARFSRVSPSRNARRIRLARTERKTAKGYVGFSFHADKDVTLEQDLMRRDLTINAMAQDADGKIIDPFGGQRDLAAGIFAPRFPGASPKTPSASCVLPALPRVTGLKSPKKP